VNDYALVCVFTHPDGRSRPLGVTHGPSGDGWYALLYKAGERAEASVYATVGACDADFMGVVEDWAMEGFEFNRSITIPVSPFGSFDSADAWADLILDSVVIPTKRR
jgi:hypothetical protein